MITYLKGDLFSSPAKILVNAVNTVGVMGKGVALEFKKQYPEMFYRYKQLCEDHQLKTGNLFLWKKEKKWVLLFPTKEHWRNPSKLEYIEAGLRKFAENWDKLGADSFAFPRLGCGNGALNWDDVRPLMERYLKELPLQIYIYVDQYADPKPEHQQGSEIERWLNGENDAEGYERFKLQMHSMLARDKGILLSDGIQVDLLADRDKIVIGCDEKHEIDNEQLCIFWNYVRDIGVINEAEIPGEFTPFARAILEIMKSLSYVEPVIISDNGTTFDSRANAYQFVAG